MVCSASLPPISRQPQPQYDMPDKKDGQSNRFYFVVKSGGNPDQRFPLDRSEMLIGRNDPETGNVAIDLSSQDKLVTVSRKHLRCEIRDKGVFIEDMGSLNGTYINGPKKIEPGRKYPIHPGDVVALGTHVILKLKEGDS